MIPVNVLKKRSLRAMGGVHKQVELLALELIQWAYEEGIFVQISSGYRSYEEQARLYGQGRPWYKWQGKSYGTEGRIVTNAEPGESVHNRGRAIDYFLVTPDGKKAIWTVNDNWLRVADIAKGMGFTWGGDWTSFPDYPHLEWNGIHKVPPVRRGAKGRRVKEIQKKLMEAGYSLHPYGADGSFGPLTERAVKQFQRDHRLKVDGIVGPITWSYLI